MLTHLRAALRGVNDYRMRTSNLCRLYVCVLLHQSTDAYKQRVVDLVNKALEEFDEACWVSTFFV